MKLTERLRPALLRWDRLLAVAALALPFVAAMLAGFAWMIEHGWLIEFIVGSISLGGLVALIRLLRLWMRGRAAGAAPRPDQLHARVDPAWGEREIGAFEAAQVYIEERTASPLPWEDLQPIAQEVVQRVAAASGKGDKGVLDFTVPEALLLIDRVAVRLRSDIRDKVPFSDSISVGTLLWLWQRRDVAWKVKKHGWNAWRVIRAVKSLPTAVLREIEGVIAEGHSSFVTSEGTAILQALLLEEVAAAAVELYSGRLRFSDSELLDLGLASSDLDRARLAASDMPLRIAVAGQISAGKSSLVNALLGADLAEVDVIPTTDAPKTYPTDFDGVETMLLDMPGLDGSDRLARTVAGELARADLVIWTIRANRPAREIDRATIALLREIISGDPRRRMPPVVVVVSCVDALLPGWPFPEGHLTAEAMERVTEVVAAVQQDIADPRATANTIPVVLTEPDWNVDRLRARIDSLVGPALDTQRNRLRIEAKTSGMRREAARAGRGLRGALTAFGRKYAQGDDAPEGES
ncbi:50S ribosome-binding GTPase [Yangia mangrovi]|uniref:50S ribosome-binding GTPase n=2 Tax=Alloyangia mangrovi TaxID=1779329 RepID=A0ABT2KNM3_9RHOB|nr:50S ribosome-binding GTPase [Alloyangia mangrovi]